ncbi:APC family permease [Haloarcula salina]|uniref:APC family permease n=1 Tax=Haloarcula salina TaxID=1429914 RepID=A0AA41KH73_9EURY|nr:APC family permease [Haloarcula salina]MBV0901436.1 APC family permease [Haloarcula salina]
MGEADLGLTEAVSIALGGMIGGGIYAVMGVVAKVTMTATWAAFALAGVVALCAGYSYNALNERSDDRGGAVSFVQCYLGNSTLAGMVGWTLLFGYIGSMAMYAFAFAEFAITLGLPAGLAGLPTRPVVSVLAVAGFVGLNLLGARSTGMAENVLVALKVAILVAFGILGLVYATGYSSAPLELGFGRLAGVSPLVAAAISFVAFQGWQLLFYDQDSIENPTETIRKAVYVSIPAAVVVYVLVGVVTVNLVPDALTSHPHVALKDAASMMMQPYGLASVGAILLSVSALFSTGSAINATLFSAAHFAKGMLTDDLLPDDLGDSDADGVPQRTLLVIGVITAAFSAVGSLSAITSFASLSFIVIFGAMSVLAFSRRDADGVNPIPPAIGAVGSAAFFPLMLYNLYSREPNTFYMVLVVAAAVVAVELLYFERSYLEREVTRVESAVTDAVGSDD